MRLDPGKKTQDITGLGKDRNEAANDHHGGGDSGNDGARSVRVCPARVERARVRLHARDRMAPRRGPCGRLAQWARPRSLRPRAGRQLRRIGPPAGLLRTRPSSWGNKRAWLAVWFCSPLCGGDGDGTHGLRDRPDTEDRTPQPARPHPRRGICDLRPPFLGALFSLWRRFEADPRWQGHAIYTLATGILAVLLLWLPSVAYYLFIVTLLVWIEVTAIRLWRST